MFLPLLITLLPSAAAVLAAVLFSEDVQAVANNQVAAAGVEAVGVQGFATSIPTTTVKVAIQGVVSYLGTGGNTLTFNLRRGTLVTSPLIATATVPIIDGGGNPLQGTAVLNGIDSVAGAGTAQYVLTVLAAGGTCTISTAAIDTKVLSG